MSRAQQSAASQEQQARAAAQQGSAAVPPAAAAQGPSVPSHAIAPEVQGPAREGTGRHEAANFAATGPSGGKLAAEAVLPARPKRLPLISREADRRNREGAQGPTDVWVKKTPLSHSCVSLQQKLAGIRCTSEEMGNALPRGSGAAVASLPRSGAAGGKTSSTPCLISIVRTEI